MQKWQIDIPNLSSDVHTGVTGFFGPVTNENHYVYGSTPSAGVAALAVCFDQLAPQNVTNWNLPIALRPGDAFTTPTRNLLGWRPRIGHQMSAEARNLLQECGIEGDYEPVSGEIAYPEFW